MSAILSRRRLRMRYHSFSSQQSKDCIVEPYRLAWYEEPVPPERVEETREIRRQIQQPMAGGEAHGSAILVEGPRGPAW